MKQLILTALTFLASFSAFSQINLQDSTLQVIGYWDNNEKQTYVITNEKYKVTGADTTDREFITYEVDITVKDSTAKSYTIEWLYRDIRINTENQFTKKLASISDNMKVVIKTDEMGAFQEVVNWKEVRDHVKQSAALLRKEFKHIPKIDVIVNQVENAFTTREAIESAAIKDIQQFYTYHGGRYTLGNEINGQVKVPNLFGGEPFSADVSIVLDEINADDDNAVLRMWQIVDSGQLTDATFAYLKKMAVATGSKVPQKGDMPPLQNEVRNAARIHGPSGWIIYSVETKEVSAENILSLEERIIEIK